MSQKLLSAMGNTGQNTRDSEYERSIMAWIEIAYREISISGSLAVGKHSFLKNLLWAKMS